MRERESTVLPVILSLCRLCRVEAVTLPASIFPKFPTAEYFAYALYPPYIYDSGSSCLDIFGPISSAERPGTAAWFVYCLSSNPKRPLRGRP